jgi:hypothetical protein
MSDISFSITRPDLPRVARPTAEEKRFEGVPVVERRWAEGVCAVEIGSKCGDVGESAEGGDDCGDSGRAGRDVVAREASV